MLGVSCLAERLGRHVDLSVAERGALDDLESQDRAFRRGSVIIAENEKPRDLYVVRSGWLHSSVVLGNGSRQIMRFHLRGDLLSLPSLAFSRAPETVTAVTDVVLCPFSRERLAALMSEHPRLASLLLALTVADRVALADRLASIGRTSARARVASLFCELASRLRVMEEAAGDVVAMPLTQEEIGDATGLTAVHVNRMVRQLADDGIIERIGGGQLRIRDSERLCADAAYVDRDLSEIGWLPSAR